MPGGGKPVLLRVVSKTGVGVASGKIYRRTWADREEGGDGERGGTRKGEGEEMEG